MANAIVLTPSQSSLTRFMKHIHEAGVPAKVDTGYLKSVGFKSGNDSYLVPILKSIGFLSSGGVPENRWRSYKDRKRAPAVLAEGVKQCYSNLFAVYPDAYRKDDEAIRNWVRSQTDFDEVKVGYAVATFKTLCGLASFDGLADEPAAKVEASAVVTPAAPVVVASPQIQGRQAAPGQPIININIELHLPPSQDGASYEKLFESMKKHLFPDEPPPS